MINLMSRRKILTTPTLLHYYKFDGNSNDSVGGANGTDFNLTYVAGTNHQRAYFGASQVAKITFNEYLVYQLSEFSITFLVEFESIGDRQDLFASDNSPYPLILRLWEDGEFRANVKGVGTVSMFSSLGDFTTGVVYHIGVTYDGAILKLYLNGVEVDSEPGTGAVGNGSSIIPGNPQFGGISPTPSNDFFGYLENFKIWNYPFNSQQVLEEASLELNI